MSEPTPPLVRHLPSQWQRKFRDDPEFAAIARMANDWHDQLLEVRGEARRMMRMFGAACPLTITSKALVALPKDFVLVRSEDLLGNIRFDVAEASGNQEGREESGTS